MGNENEAVQIATEGNVDRFLAILDILQRSYIYVGYTVVGKSFVTV